MLCAHGFSMALYFSWSHSYVAHTIATKLPCCHRWNASCVPLIALPFGHAAPSWVAAAKLTLGAYLHIHSGRVVWIIWSRFHSAQYERKVKFFCHWSSGRYTIAHIPSEKTWRQSFVERSTYTLACMPSDQSAETKRFPLRVRASGYLPIWFGFSSGAKIWRFELV